MGSKYFPWLNMAQMSSFFLIHINLYLGWENIEIDHIKVLVQSVLSYERFHPQLVWGFFKKRSIFDFEFNSCLYLLDFLANEFFIQFSQNIAPVSATKSQTEFGISRIHFIFKKKREIPPFVHGIRKQISFSSKELFFRVNPIFISAS